VKRVAREYLVSGRVQGVGFRYFIQAAAARAAVCGWVTNLPDGCVAIVAEGAAEALEQFERDIHIGPPGAIVERVDIRQAAPDERRTGFNIR
jgi:acylphosphatase